MGHLPPGSEWAINNEFRHAGPLRRPTLRPASKPNTETTGWVAFCSACTSARCVAAGSQHGSALQPLQVAAVD
ncbi:MAG: hypothetical protein JWR32_6778 [Mycobacterium sp.]|nr:hypothetical protein [Mycobacterium sp.]